VRPIDTRALVARVLPVRGRVGLFFVLLAALTASCGRSLPPAALSASLIPATATQPAHVTIAGLSSDELRAIKTAGWGMEQWQAFAAVRVEDAGDVSVTGRYVARADAVAFEPAFPFDPGRRYVVRIDPSRLPTPRAAPAVLTAVALPALEATDPTVVTAIDPASDAWPSNLLRFYIHFSGPMARDPGTAFVRPVCSGQSWHASTSSETTRSAGSPGAVTLVPTNGWCKAVALRVTLRRVARAGAADCAEPR